MHEAEGRPRTRARSGAARPSPWPSRLRLASGLFLFLYVVCHFVNHALGLVSLAAMEAGRAVFLAFWRLPLVEPEPMRVPGGLAGWVGGNAIRAGMLAKEAAEEEGAVAPALHRGLAAIPERIGFHIGR